MAQGWTAAKTQRAMPQVGIRRGRGSLGSAVLLRAPAGKTHRTPELGRGSAEPLTYLLSSLRSESQRVLLLPTPSPGGARGGDYDGHSNKEPLAHRWRSGRAPTPRALFTPSHSPFCKGEQGRAGI